MNTDLNKSEEALQEKIENEIDLKAILAYESRLKSEEVEYIPFDDIKKELDL